MRTCVAMLLIAVANVQAAAQDNSSNAEVMAAKIESALALMNQRAPIAISPVQKMTKVRRDGNAIIYQIETAVPKDEWTQEMRDKSSRDMTKVMCSDKNTRTLLDDYGYELRYAFSDTTGVSVMDFVVTRDKCPNLP